MASVLEFRSGSDTTTFLGQRGYGGLLFRDGNVEVPPVTYTGVMTAGNIRTTFSRAVIATVPLQTLSNYSLVSPSGAVSLTLLSATIFSTTDVDLAFNGDPVVSGSYVLTISNGVAIAANDLGINEDTSASIEGAGAGPLSGVCIDSTSPNTVSVRFSKGVRQVNAVNSDDGLNPANYVIDTLTVNSVTPVSASEVILNTSTQTTGTVYTWAISNIKDIAGNIVT